MPKRRIRLKPGTFSDRYLRLKSEAIHKWAIILSAFFLIGLCRIQVAFMNASDFSWRV